jgi:hypothetical protein
MTSERSYKGDNVNAHIMRNEAGNILVMGQIEKFAGFQQTINWIAPKGIHRGMSFSGSGLPYQNADQAFEGTENTGVIKSPDGSFVLEMPTFPSAYYTGLGSVYVPPVLMLEAVKGDERFRTHVFLSPEGVPFRWSSGAPPGPRAEPNNSELGRAMFYNGREQLPIFQNQEMLLRSRGYPSDETAYALPGRMDKNPWENAPSPA